VPSTEAEAAHHEAALPAVVALAVAGEPARWREPRGCAKCGQTGFRGRVGLYEIAPATQRLISGLRTRADEDVLTQIAREDGFLSFAEDGFIKARRGETTIAEVYRVARAGED
jgi:general secretion pathway protein E